MMRLASTVMLIGASRAAAVAPEAKAEVNATARLEALVRDMAQGQRASAPTPQPLSAEEVVILEGGERRRLGRCTCNVYRNGAVAGDAVCNKLESGSRVCYPQTHAGGCSDREATLCGSSGGRGGTVDTLRASPGPTFFDAEEDDDVYLNVNLQIKNAGVTNPSMLPSNNQFAAALAQLADVPQGRVNVRVTWGVDASVRAPAAGSAGTTATVHATLSVKNSRRREDLEAKLLMAEELPEIQGRSFSIVYQEVRGEVYSPLVCDEQAESTKAQATALLRQLVELKRQEAALLAAGATVGGSAVCDDALLHQIAHQLGVENVELAVP